MTAKINPPTDSFPFPTIDLDTGRLIEVTEHLIAAHVGYGLGAKPASPDSPTGSFYRVDCSGFVGWALSEASYDAFTALFGLGSVQQHEYIDAHGFKPSTVDAAANHDGIVRIAFLTPQAGGGIGHVMLIAGDGMTCESHGGGVGPDRRAWDPDVHSFMGKCQVYVLTAPGA